MNPIQRSNAVKNFKIHNKRYYQVFLWGGQPITNRPSPQDISQIITDFTNEYGTGMYANVAEHVAVSVLNP